MSDQPVSIEDRKPSRAEVRAAIFNKKPNSMYMTFNGAHIELRQPNMNTLLSAQVDENRVKNMAKMLIAYAYVPGTDEKVFDDTDVDGICTLPWNEDMQLLQENIAELTSPSAKVKSLEKNFEPTQDS